MRLICLPSEQGTGTSETCICADCDTPETREQARKVARSIPDIPKHQEFVDCSGNEALNCSFCGSNNEGRRTL